MKYFIVSNVIAVIGALVIPVIYLICSYDYMRFTCNLIILLLIFESLIFKCNVDIHNYKYIIGRYKFKIPRSVLIIISILLTIGCIICMYLMDNNLKWLFSIGIILSHIIAYYYVISKYYLPIVGCSAIFPMFIMSYRPLYIAIMILSLPYFFSLAYFLNYEKQDYANYIFY